VFQPKAFKGLLQWCAGLFVRADDTSAPHSFPLTSFLSRANHGGKHRRPVRSGLVKRSRKMMQRAFEAAVAAAAKQNKRIARCHDRQAMIGTLVENECHEINAAEPPLWP
jgi:hypothetical protein